MDISVIDSLSDAATSTPDDSDKGSYYSSPIRELLKRNPGVEFEFTKQGPDHKPVFTASFTIGSRIFKGVGPKLVVAKQHAAIAFLYDPETPTITESESKYHNRHDYPMAKLNTRYPKQFYDVQVIGSLSNPETFRCSVNVEGITYIGFGKTKKMSKNQAAARALEGLESEGTSFPVTRSSKKKVTFNIPESSESSSTKLSTDTKKSSSSSKRSSVARSEASADSRPTTASGSSKTATFSNPKVGESSSKKLSRDTKKSCSTTTTKRSSHSEATTDSRPTTTAADSSSKQAPRPMRTSEPSTKVLDNFTIPKLKRPAAKSPKKVDEVVPSDILHSYPITPPMTPTPPPPAMPPTPPTPPPPRIPRMLASNAAKDADEEHSKDRLSPNKLISNWIAKNLWTAVIHPKSAPQPSLPVEISDSQKNAISAWVSKNLFSQQGSVAPPDPTHQVPSSSSDAADSEMSEEPLPPGEEPPAAVFEEPPPPGEEPPPTPVIEKEPPQAAGVVAKAPLKSRFAPKPVSNTPGSSDIDSDEFDGAVTPEIPVVVANVEMAFCNESSSVAAVAEDVEMAFGDKANLPETDLQPCVSAPDVEIKVEGVACEPMQVQEDELQVSAEPSGLETKPRRKPGPKFTKRLRKRSIGEQLEPIVVQGAVEDCLECNQPLELSGFENMSVDLKTGNSTIKCNNCGVTTTMAGALHMKKFKFIT